MKHRMASQEYYMDMAIRLARKGIGRNSARAICGAVVVGGGKPVGYGYADDATDRPAILVALEEAGPLAKDATIYTNVEPGVDCEQPEAHLLRILEFRPERLVIGYRSKVLADVPSRILASFESAGITVDTGLCEDQCLETNEVYYKYRQTGLPFVTVKFAASLDGRIATSSGESQWISSPLSLRLAHQFRREHDAVLVGIGTVLADDPQLTVRLVSGRSPMRIVIDTSLRIPDTARLLLDADPHCTIIATTDRADLSRVSRLEKLGAEVLVLPAAPRPAPAIPLDPQISAVSGPRERYGVSLKSLLAMLGERHIASLLVEGGSAVITSLLADRSVDRLVIAIAPKIIGKGTEAIGDLGIERLRDAITFSSTKTWRLGGDIIFDGRLHPTDRSS
jgi:diaminohydroxyphosphoribosylaminopyrimidine deaminase/5-amino-6-(5-phosphoribosylamino)uracil reductase